MGLFCCQHEKTADDEANERELHRDRKCLGDALADGVVGSTIGTEVSMEKASHIADIADWPRIVEAMLFVVLGHGFRRG